LKRKIFQIFRKEKPMGVPVPFVFPPEKPVFPYKWIYFYDVMKVDEKISTPSRQSGCGFE